MEIEVYKELAYITLDLLFKKEKNLESIIAKLFLYNFIDDGFKIALKEININEIIKIEPDVWFSYVKKTANDNQSGGFIFCMPFDDTSLNKTLPLFFIFDKKSQSGLCLASDENYLLFDIDPTILGNNFDLIIATQH